MTTNTPSPSHDHTEHCDSCQRPTEHAVNIEIRQEGNALEDAEGFSREPYRIATCRACGDEQVQRMNNA